MFSYAPPRSGVFGLRSAPLLVAVAICAAPARAQAPPYALFQYSSLTASGNAITATMVPVVVAPNVTRYVNLLLQFNVDANGGLTLAAGYPQEIPAPVLLTSSFKPGTYAGPSAVLSGKALIVVAGPGVSNGGTTEWTLSSAAGADPCTYPLTATWYVGPLNGDHPLSSRVTAAGITSTAYSFGTSVAGQCGGLNADWFSNALIGVSQVGNTLTIVSFTVGQHDYNTPQSQVTYTLQQ